MYFIIYNLKLQYIFIFNTKYIIYHFLEYLQIRDLTAFASFPFFRAWPAISAVFLERLLYFPLSFRKQFCLSDMVDIEWNGAGQMSYYFAYQRAKFFAGNKITYTIS